MIEIKNIHKSFRGVEVLRGIDLSVQPGETVALIGSSGSGKSTLINLIAEKINAQRNNELFKNIKKV